MTAWEWIAIVVAALIYLIMGIGLAVVDVMFGTKIKSTSRQIVCLILWPIELFFGIGRK
jgi:hypothetical protein